MSKVNREKIIKYGIYLSVLVPLIIFSEFISPFHFGKVLIFRSLVEIIAVFYIVLLIKHGRVHLPPRTPIFWAVSFFTLAFVYQVFFGSKFVLCVLRIFAKNRFSMGDWFRRS